jgi:hypothetical protein
MHSSHAKQKQRQPMKKLTLMRIKARLTGRLTPALLVAAMLSFGLSPSAQAGNDKQGNSGILPPQSDFRGKSYAEWSASWWQWFLEHPMEGHPANPNPNSGYDVRSGQSDNVWYLASAWPQPAIEIRVGTALFIPLVDAECSRLALII